MRKIVSKKAALLETKRFSNKNYSIRIDFYEYNMAAYEVDYKRRGNTVKVNGYDYVRSCKYFFDQCKIESMYDYFDMLKGLDKDKVARRWFIREMRYCTGHFLFPDGRFNRVRTEEAENWIFYCSRKRFERMNVEMVKSLKGICGEELCGSFRAIFRISNEEGAIKYPPNAYQQKAFVRRVLNRKRERSIVKSTAVLLEWIKFLSPQFYHELERDRTLDDCEIVIYYWGLQKGFPSMEISVYDCGGYVSYDIF